MIFKINDTHSIIILCVICLLLFHVCAIVLVFIGIRLLSLNLWNFMGMGLVILGLSSLGLIDGVMEYGLVCLKVLDCLGISILGISKDHRFVYYYLQYH